MYKKNFATWNKKKQRFSDEKGITLRRAMAKISLTVYYAYIHPKILDEIIEVRTKFNIPANFYTEYKVEDSISGFIEPLLAKNLIKPEKVEHGMDFIDLLLAATMEKWKKEFLKTDSDEISKKLGTHLNNNKILDDYNPKYINERLWSFIIFAKLYEVPLKRVWRCMNNLLYYHWPTVNGINNDVIQIEVYASTTEEEYKFIWSDIQEKQRIFIKDLDTRGKFEYPKLNRDIRIGEIKKENPEFTNEQIKQKLIDENLATKDFNASRIPEIIKNPWNRIKEFSKKTSKHSNVSK